MNKLALVFATIIIATAGVAQVQTVLANVSFGCTGDPHDLDSGPTGNPHDASGTIASGFDTGNPHDAKLGHHVEGEHCPGAGVLGP